MNAGVFETIRVRTGGAPFLERHAARLEAACRALDLPLPGPPLADLVAPWLGSSDVVVRVEVAGTDVHITTRPVPSAAPLAVMFATVRHSPYPHKTTSRSAFEAAQAEAKAAGADDALLLTAAGLVAEGAVWSMFWWEGDRLATPARTLGVLPGIARARIMALVPTIERERPPDELVGCSVFAANAVRGIIPIRSLDGGPVPDDPRTARLAARFWPA